MCSLRGMAVFISLALIIHVVYKLTLFVSNFTRNVSSIGKGPNWKLLWLYI